MLVMIGKYEYTVPTSWNELTRRQLLQVHRAFLRSAEDGLEVSLFRLLRILTGMSWWRYVMTPAHVLADYLYLTHFLIKESNLTRQLLPRYRGLYGPGDSFRGLLMCEFANTEYYFMEWDRGVREGAPDQTLLDNLVAILYRPARWKYLLFLARLGDPRRAFEENRAAWYARHIIRHWPRHVKEAIAAWYAGCRQEVVQNNPEVFGGSGESARYGILSVMRDVAKAGVHGDFDKVQFKPVYLIMIELNEMVHESRNQPQIPTL